MDKKQQPHRSAAPKAYRDSLLQDMQDPVEAMAYLYAALEEGDFAVFCLVLQDVADANGGHLPLPSMP